MTEVMPRQNAVIIAPVSEAALEMLVVSRGENGILLPVLLRRFFTTIRYYWITAKGYRLRPWASPYIRWRMETFYGAEAAELDAAKFFNILWRDRARMRRFMTWVSERRRAQHRGGV